MPATSLAEALAQSTERCRRMDAPLAVRLQALADDVRALSAPFAEIVDRMVARLQSQGVGETAPSPGDPMPPFVLPDQDGHLVSLEALLESGPVVLAFHRGQWCPYCQINADALARLDPEVTALGARIVAITPNVQQFNSELQGGTCAPFPVLSDMDNGYALELNLAIRVPEEKRQAMTGAGWDIAVYQRSDAWLLPIPATFVVGTDGRVKARFVDPDYRKRMAVEDILSALRAA